MDGQVQPLDARPDAVSASEGRFEAVLESDVWAMALGNTHGDLIAANQPFADLLGYSRSELTGMNLEAFTFPADLERERVLIDEMLTAKRTSYRIEKRYVRKDGSLVWVELEADCLLDVEGEVEFGIVIAHDISARQRAEEALRESEERNRLLHETMLQGVVYQDADGSILSMNPAAEHILGKRPEDFLGQTSVAVEHDTLREDGSPFPGLEHPAMVALRTGKPVPDVLMQVYNPREQRYRLIDIQAVPLLRPGEQSPYCVYTVFDDVTERKRIEAALGESEERLQRIAETARIGFVEYDVAADSAYWSKEDYELFGFEPGSKISWRLWLDGVHPADRERVAATYEGLIRRAGAAGSVRGHTYEYRYVRPDGSVIWIGSEMSVETAGGGPVVRGMVRDISERKRLEEELARREAELHHLVRHAATGIYEIDFRGPRFVSVNDFMCTYSGYSREELLETNPMDLLDEDSRTRFRERIERVLTGRPVDSQVEYCFLTRQGEKRYAVLNVTPTYEDRQPVGAFVVGQDVTDRRAAEEALRDSEERFRFLLRSSRDVLYRVDLRNGRYDYISPSVESMTGFTPEELMSKSRDDSIALVHPDDLPLLEDAVRRVVESGQAEAEYRQRARNGEYRWLSNLMMLVRDAHGAPHYRIGTIRDVTEQKRAEAAQLEREVDRAAQEERTRIARDLHDSVTQALFAAALKAEALTLTCEEETATTAALEEVRRLSRGALAQMRTMLLELRGDPVWEVPLPQLLRHLAEAAEGRANVKVVLELDEEVSLPPKVHEAVYRITQEALNNVARHAKAENAWVQLRAQDGHIQLVVGDDGRGFEKASVGRGHFGLSMMRERAAETDGDFSVRSQAGEGTAVTVGWRVV